MRRTLAIWILGMVALAGTARANEKEARAILDRAIKAHGGTAAMTRAIQFKRSDKGTHSRIPFSSQWVCRLPDKVRLTIEHGGGGKTVVVLNGDKAWQSDGGPAAELLPARVRELREEAYVDWVATLVPLTKSGFTLSALPKTSVDGKSVVGVQVKRKGQPELHLYFLESGGLLVKIEREARVAGLKVDKEYLYSEHKAFDGVKLPTRQTVLINGKKFTEFTSSDISFPSKLDAKTFDRP